MARRIARHQADRAAAGWRTVEETLDVAGALQKLDARETVLVDCLTLWINNLLFEEEKTSTTITEEEIIGKSRELVAAAQGRPGTTIFVANEVGLGIVPDNDLARRFRDLAGRCNQTMAAAADTVVLMVSGIPVCIKGKSDALKIPLKPPLRKGEEEWSPL